MTKHISQREARRLLKRVRELEIIEERRVSRWCSDYPGGIHIANLRVEGEVVGRLVTAASLGFALVGKTHDGKELKIYAVRGP